MQVSFADIQIQLKAHQNYETLNGRYFYNFGQVPLNSFRTVSYMVTNKGTENLQFSNAVIWGSNFDAFHTCSGGLRPNEQCRFEIRYRPFIRGIHSGQFNIRFQDANLVTDTISVDLWGEGV
jgi:hypothetical protein